VWDIREACLKRYGKVIGKRPEYHLRTKSTATKTALTHEQVLLGEGLSNTNGNSNHERILLEIPLPPLPERSSGPNQPQPAEIVANNHIHPGEFVYNDLIDEGVRIISKLQHERVLAPDTQSARQIPPKVICVARCPYGSHFATGSDDGICRIWRDEDDVEVEKIDAELCNRRLAGTNSSHTTSKF
jgi:WD40 repeat protein